MQLRRVVRAEFRKHRAETDPSRVEALKSNAVRALANYLMLEAASKDQRLQDRISAFASSAAQSMAAHPLPDQPRSP
jgi:mannose/cellobiose epimerase-like protein (N-acyl-D-glucosamine 2-epimerase family)